MKRIAIFADGTWHSPEKGLATNVLQLARGVCSRADGMDQVVFYDWGVGTDRKKITGGISGAGIDKNIMDCYRFIVHNYHEDDALYFFGFSRGAYTVRSLGGLIRNAGILKREHADQIPNAYRLYRKRGKFSSPDANAATLFRQQFSVANLSYIHYMGVWDTVGANGIPVPFWGTLGKKEFLFHDTEPSRIVRHARHAVSIDENREDFAPTLWNSKQGIDLKQAWFAGAHSDIGGGYRESGLSHCACQWVLQEAEHFGLKFEQHVQQWLQPHPYDLLHNERKGIYRIRENHIRSISGPIHVSAQKRWNANTHQYRKKSKAMRQALQAVNGDWNRIKVIA